MVAIITGDIINSRKQESELWLEPLKVLFQELGKSPEKWEFFRGDSFQLEIENPLDALKWAFRIKATVKCIKELDVRMAIGLGRTSYQGTRISESNGEAFIYSGETFDLLHKNTLGFKSSWSDFDRDLNLCLMLLMMSIDKWTQAGAEIAKVYLQNTELSQAELGDILGLKQNTISDRFNRAHLHEVMSVENWYREKLFFLK